MAGIIVDEYQTDPTISGYAIDNRLFGISPPICRQILACGQSPSVSQPFSAQTAFITLTIGCEQTNNSVYAPAIFYELGFTPVVDPAGSPWIPLAYSVIAGVTKPINPPLIVKAVGAGQRMAVLGLGV